MAQIKVSELPTVTTIAVTDFFPVNKAVTSSKISWQSLLDLLAVLYQAADADLTAVANGGTSTAGLNFLKIGTPTTNSYPKVGAGAGNVTLRTAAQLLSELNAQTHADSLDTLASHTPTTKGLSLLTLTNEFVGGYLKAIGDLEQTFQLFTPASTVSDLRTNGALMVPRTTASAAPASPIVPNADTTDVLDITGLTGALTFSKPTGSPGKAQSLIVKVKDNGTARALTWNAAYHANATTALPVITVVGTTYYIKFLYNGTADAWDALVVAQCAS